MLIFWGIFVRYLPLLVSQWWHFSKSSLRDAEDATELWTTEKREVCPVKVQHLLLELQVNLRYKLKNNGPWIELWGTVVLMCDQLGMNVSAHSGFRYLNTLVYTLNHHAKLYQKLLISLEKSLWHLMTDLHQTLCRYCALLITVDIRKDYLGKNLTDCRSKN